MSGWHALGARWCPANQVEVGEIIALDRGAWRVTGRDEDGDELVFHAIKLNSVEKRPHTMRVQRHRGLDILSEHYSICVNCGDIQPCLEQDATKAAAEAAKQAERYEIAGICPGCCEVVTARQQSITFNENVMTPLGPPVTFHRRQKCFRSAIRYDQAWAKDQKRTPKLEESLTCDGALFKHRDGITTCTSIDCPSPRAWHGRWSQCSVRSHGCPRFECQFGVSA